MNTLGNTFTGISISTQYVTTSYRGITPIFTTQSQGSTYQVHVGGNINVGILTFQGFNVPGFSFKPNTLYNCWFVPNPGETLRTSNVGIINTPFDENGNSTIYYAKHNWNNQGDNFYFFTDSQKFPDPQFVLDNPEALYNGVNPRGTFSITEVDQSQLSSKDLEDIKKGISDVKTSIDNTNNKLDNVNSNLNNINQSITDDTVNVDSSTLPSDTTDDITSTGFDNIFQQLYTTFTSGSAQDLVITIPFTGKSFTINTSNVYAGAELGLVKTLINIFWYFIISYFIVKDIGKKINKIKSGDIEHVQEDNIKEDLL